MSALLLAVALASGLYAEPDKKADDKKPADKESRYSGSGITFTYPKDWKVKAEDQKGFSAITVSKDKGTLAMIQVYQVPAPPKMAADATVQGLRKAFEGKLVKGSDKPVERKVLGADRKGQAMEFEVAKGVTIRVEVFAFEALPKKRTIAITLMSNSLGGDGGKKGFEQILSSMKEQMEKKEPDKKDK